MKNNYIYLSLAGFFGILCLVLAFINYNSQNELKLVQKEVKKLEKTIENIESENSNLSQEIKDKEAQIESQLKQINGLTRDINVVNNTVNDYEENIEVLKICLEGVVEAMDYQSSGYEEEAFTTLFLVLDSCEKASQLY